MLLVFLPHAADRCREFPSQKDDAMSRMPPSTLFSRAMTYIEPTQEQLAELIAGPAGPVVMLNLLRYTRNEAGELTGQDTYMKYAEAVAPLLAGVGGSPIWMGRGDQIVIGDDHEKWDAIVLVQYPSRAAFIEFATSEAYGAISHLRIGSLEDSRLIACTENALAE